jgi:hypothetical protein
MGEGIENLVSPSPWTSRVLLHASNSYDMGPPALLPIRKEGVLRIFVALKNPSPWPGSNPQPLGPVASTLTTTPQTRPSVFFINCFIIIGLFVSNFVCLCHIFIHYKK